MTSEQLAEQHRSLRFAWTSLLVWASVGFGLEVAHGFKLAVYLDDDLTRTLLRLGHAHGVGLALVVIGYSTTIVPTVPPREGTTPVVGRLLRSAALLMPLGFTLSSWRHPEGDPSIAVALVPLGAACLLLALTAIAISLWRRGD